MTESHPESEIADDEIHQIYQGLPYPPSFTQALGELIVEFAALEGALFDLAIELACGPNYLQGAILVAGVPYTGLVDRYCSLLLQLRCEDEAFCGQVDALRRQLLDVGERRNRLVHSKWFLEPTEGRIIRMKASAKGRSGLRFDTPTVPVSELTELGGDIREARQAVHLLALPLTGLSAPASG